MISVGRLTLVFILPVVVGCTNKTGVLSSSNPRGYIIDATQAASGQNERISSLIFHYTAVDDETSLRLLTQEPVSAHYLIPSAPAYQQGKPQVFQLVAEDKRAWHAGVSQWGGRSNLNDSSIGVEIVNAGFSETADGRIWYPYTADQVALLTSLAKNLIEKYAIAPENVLGHSDISPMRKSDPGPLFPWKSLAENGIGAWPDRQRVEKNLAGRLPGKRATSGHCNLYCLSTAMRYPSMAF